MTVTALDLILPRFVFLRFFFRVIVGAPTADTSDLQEGVVNGGAVFRCDISEDNRCSRVPFDAKGKFGFVFVQGEPLLLTSANLARKCYQ